MSGCIDATAPLINANAVKNDGLPVAHIGTRGSPSLKIDAIISGQEHAYAVTDHYLRLPLKPGTYQFEKIVEKSSYKSGNTTYFNTHTLPVKFKFTIRAGRVTNIGEMVFYFPPKQGKNKKGKTFNVLFLDNSAEMHQFIKKSHPDVYAALRSKEFLKADVKYLNAKQIKGLRTIMLATARISPPGYVAGSLGSFAKVNRDKKGKIKDLKFYDTGTFKPIGPCVYSKSRHACIVPSTKKNQTLFNADKKKIVPNKLPTKNPIALLRLVGEQDIVIATNQMEIFTSLNNGKSWSSHLRSKVEHPLKERYHPRILYDQTGYYVYSRGDDPTILHRKYNSAATYKMIKPPASEKFEGLYSTDKGLYTDPEYTVFGDGEIFFQAKGQTKWQQRSLPSSGCTSLRVLNRTNDKLAATCGLISWITEDQGKSWPKAKKNEIKKS